MTAHNTVIPNLTFRLLEHLGRLATPQGLDPVPGLDLAVRSNFCEPLLFLLPRVCRTQDPLFSCVFRDARGSLAMKAASQEYKCRKICSSGLTW